MTQDVPPRGEFVEEGAQQDRLFACVVGTGDRKGGTGEEGRGIFDVQREGKKRCEVWQRWDEGRQEGLPSFFRLPSFLPSLNSFT